MQACKPAGYNILTAKRSHRIHRGPPCYLRMPMPMVTQEEAIANGYVELDQKKKPIISHTPRPSAAPGGHYQYSPTERRSRSPSATQENLTETVRERQRRERSASTRRTSTASRASPSNQMTTPPSASTNQRNQRKESNASARRRNTSSSASPSNQRTTPPPRSASIRRRNTSSSMSPANRIKTPPPRSISRTYSSGTPSLSPIDREMRNFSFGSIQSDMTSSPAPFLATQEVERIERATLELKRRTSAAQERSTPTPDRISAPHLQHGLVSPERVPKRPSTNFTSSAQTQTQRLHGVVLNSSPGHPTRPASRSPSPISPLQTSPSLPRYQSSGSPTDLEPRHSTPRTNTSRDRTPEFAVPAKPRPKPSGSFESQLHVDTSTKTTPK